MICSGELPHKQNKRQRPSLPELFLTFAKIGASTFGGGYAVLPVLQKEVVAKKGWLGEQELAEQYALAQCLPGLIVVNLSTFICLPLRGAAGVIAGVLGIITPPFAIILLLVSVLDLLSGAAWLGHALAGIRLAVIVLIIQAAGRMRKTAIIDTPALLIALAVMLLLAFNLLGAIYLLLFSALAGIGVHLIKRRLGAEK